MTKCFLPLSFGAFKWRLVFLPDITCPFVQWASFAWPLRLLEISKKVPLWWAYGTASLKSPWL